MKLHSTITSTLSLCLALSALATSAHAQAPSGAATTAGASATPEDTAEWNTADDLDEARGSMGVSAGTLALNDGASVFFSYNLTPWLEIAPTLYNISSPDGDVSAHAYAGTLRFQTPFGDNGYRVFIQNTFGALQGYEGEANDVAVDTQFRYMNTTLGGAEVQVWDRLTVSLAIGSTSVHRGFSAVHPNFSTSKFTAMTGLRWYL